MSAAIELTNFRTQPVAQTKTIIKYTFTCGDVVYLPKGEPVTHICKRKPEVYLLDERYEKLNRQLKEYQQRPGPTLYDDFRSSFTDKDLEFIFRDM